MCRDSANAPTNAAFYRIAAEDKTSQNNVQRAKLVTKALSQHLAQKNADWIAFIRENGISVKEFSERAGLGYHAAWKQLHRGSLQIPMLRLYDFTAWLMTLAPADAWSKNAPWSLHSIWFGAAYDGKAPLLLNLFFNCLKELSDAQLEQIEPMVSHLSGKLPRGSTAELFLDRFCSLRLDYCSDFYNKHFLQFVITQAKRKLADCMDQALSPAEREELLATLDMRDAMALSWAMDVPLDYFCSTDYLPPLLGTMNFWSADGVCAPLSAEEQARFQTLLSAFARCKRREQEELLSHALELIAT